MHPPTQERYKHSVPPQKAIDLFRPAFDEHQQPVAREDRTAHKARIGITFRCDRYTQFRLSSSRQPGDSSLSSSSRIGSTAQTSHRHLRPACLMRGHLDVSAMYPGPSDFPPFLSPLSSMFPLTYSGPPPPSLTASSKPINAKRSPRIAHHPLPPRLTQILTFFSGCATVRLELRRATGPARVGVGSSGCWI